MKFSFFQYRLLAPHSPGKKISWEEWFPEDALPAEYLLLPLDHFLQVFWVSREKPENGPVEGSPYLDPREPLNLEGQEAISRFLEIAAGVFNDENGVRYLERLHDGFREGMKRQSVGPILHRLFQQGILLHERVRQDTDYFRFAVSRESIFAELAVKLLGNTASLRVAALGEGEGLNRYLEALFQIGCRHFILSARAAQQYADFSDGENVTVYDQSSLLPMLVEADMVLAFPDAGQMLSGAMLKTVLGKRGPRPFLVLAGDKDELGALRSLKRIDDLYLFSPEELGRGIATNRRLRQEVAGEVQELLRQAAREFYHWMALEEHHRFAGILGSTPAMQQLFESMARIARSNITVLIDGESGTGKELVARAIHQLSNRADRPFEVINCGAIPENLLESELFGHVRGAFTGAIGHKKGLFEAAHHGTLLLDEIGELPAQLQVKLLRVLQEGEVRRVGSTETQKVDVRVLAATNRDLREMAARGSFRSDLLYRLNVIQLTVPPLRERREDIPVLARAFLERAARKLRKRATGFSAEAIDCLQAYPWPGNVRELENVVERGVALTLGRTIGLSELPRDIQKTAVPRADAGQEVVRESGELVSLKEMERRHILAVLAHCQDNYEMASKILGIGRTTLWRKLRDYDVGEPSPAPSPKL